METRTFLHVGCGQKDKTRTTRGFAGAHWREIRLDVDPATRPDIVDTITGLGSVDSASVDAVYSSHNIEHLAPHEVPLALAAFRRVLKPSGFLVITCPDLQAVCAHVAEGRLLEPLYVSPSGPIAAIDVLYGHRPPMAAGNHFMAHRTGFTQGTLVSALQENGFAEVASMRRATHFDLWAIAARAPLGEVGLRTLAGEHFPS